eukprot:969294_1
MSRRVSGYGIAQTRNGFADKWISINLKKVPKSAPSRTSTDVVEEAKKRLCETKLELRSAGKGCDAVKELCESLISQMQKATLELDTIRNATANHRHQKE